MSTYYRFAVLGRKLGMTQIFTEDAKAIPVTVIQAGPCTVVQKKTKEKEGYDSIQIGFWEKKKQRVIKPEAGHFAKSKTPVTRHLRELRLDEKLASQYEVGQVIDASFFKPGDKVDVSGRSIGKGFQGVIKRHNFKTPDMTHNHEHFRHGGSIGCRTSPGRVNKGRKMAGQMGNKNVSTINLEIMAVDTEKNCLLIKGAVPGSKNSVVCVKASTRGGFAPRDMAPKKEEAPVTEAPAAKEEAPAKS